MCLCMLITALSRQLGVCTLGLQSLILHIGKLRRHIRKQALSTGLSLSGEFRRCPEGQMMHRVLAYTHTGFSVRIATSLCSLGRFSR